MQGMHMLSALLAWYQRFLFSPFPAFFDGFGGWEFFSHKSLPSPSHMLFSHSSHSSLVAKGLSS